MHFKNRERGQGLVEFALVLPIFLILVLGIVDFGWALKSYITITNAAREGARYGVTCHTNAQIQAQVVDYSSGLNPALTASNVTFPTANPCASGTGTPGAEVKVKVTYDYNFITPLGSFVTALGGGLTLSSTTSMRLE